MNEFVKARRIMEKVAEKYGFSTKELTKRHKLYRVAKREAILKIRKNTNLTLANIGKLFGIGHSAVHNIIKKCGGEK